MNTRDYIDRIRVSRQPAPVSVRESAYAPSTFPSWPQRPSFCPPCMQTGNSGECLAPAQPGRTHPLVNIAQNEALADYERTVRDRFAGIVAILRDVAAIQHDAEFVTAAQKIARERLGFELPVDVLSDAWVTTLDMRKLYGYSVLHTFQALARDAWMQPNDGAAEAEAMTRFFIGCGFHAVDVSACADGRLKGLLRYILRLPQQAMRRHNFYAGTLFDVEANVKQWTETELRRFREGQPTRPESGTRYLKIAVYHFSSSDPSHEGCAAHGNDNRAAAQAALDRLNAFGTAVEKGFGASVATLLVGVDTDSDAIRIHVPDALGSMSLNCAVDNIALYHATVDRSNTDAQAILERTVADVCRQHGRSQPVSGMNRLILQLLINNLSQIQYVCKQHQGRYDDIGHAERFINIGDGFEEVHLRNLAYFGHMHTVEEGAADLDVGIRIFRSLNVAHGLPIPVAIHYRYNEQVPGSRERTVARCRRVQAAILARYPDLAKDGLLFCNMTVQAQQPGSPLETVSANDRDGHSH